MFIMSFSAVPICCTGVCSLALLILVDLSIYLALSSSGCMKEEAATALLRTDPLKPFKTWLRGKSLSCNLNCQRVSSTCAAKCRVSYLQTQTRQNFSGCLTSLSTGKMGARCVYSNSSRKRHLLLLVCIVYRSTIYTRLRYIRQYTLYYINVYTFITLTLVYLDYIDAYVRVYTYIRTCTPVHTITL